ASGTPKTSPPYFPASTFSSLPEIVSDQISGDGAWMNFRFSRVPPGGPPTPTLAAGAAALRPPWQPPSVDHGALPALQPKSPPWGSPPLGMPRRGRPLIACTTIPNCAKKGCFLHSSCQ